MVVWEYAAIIVKNRSTINWMGAEGEKPMQADHPIAALNQVGRHGWEVVAAETPAHGSAYWGFGNIVYTLKRPAQR
ncbi:hypothetical protein FHR83_008931 [Actinoplanes campanulatus]|uniref:DUF4177 domain-containing protein n=1 Tax=Actinoplanes campanulatus TaxID=113559 RepID=A0A7W5ART4_9ACTN|nr:DUF4177 domain-containing protein [Actinoplanes campanulatus]MBB3101203.1 hypothetical protein [Actinoplanes campanulatus]GGN49760.1 hypothetical protein GCM10010109_88210 [Actinoplanes campanulatus]GID41950.1 hypothetical protein Aca09nite_84560 [Actinoplanes campanulatus]